MWHWLEELYRFVRYGRFGYRPQPPPECQPSVLASSSVTATHSDSYFVFAAQGAVLHAKAAALSELNVVMIHEHRRLRKLFGRSCVAPCSLDIIWLDVQVVSETVSPTGPPFTATVTVKWNYRVECN